MLKANARFAASLSFSSSVNGTYMKADTVMPSKPSIFDCLKIKIKTTSYIKKRNSFRNPAASYLLIDYLKSLAIQFSSLAMCQQHVVSHNQRLNIRIPTGAVTKRRRATKGWKHRPFIGKLCIQVDLIECQPMLHSIRKASETHFSKIDVLLSVKSQPTKTQTRKSLISNATTLPKHDIS